MQQSSCRGAGEPLLEERDLRSSAAEPRADAPLQGTAILDTHGVIRFCTAEAAHAFGAKAEDLVGRPVDTVVPELKLRRGTPGYNIAYALFWFPQQQWRTVQALSHDGRAFALDLSVSIARIDGKHQLLLTTRRPQADGEMHRSQTQTYISFSGRHAIGTSEAGTSPGAAAGSFSPAMRIAINDHRATCATRNTGA